MEQLQVETCSSQIENELPEFLQQFSEIDGSINLVLNIVTKMIQDIQNGLILTDKGLSILEVKNMMMLQYLMNLTYLVASKCCGKSIENDLAIERLVEIRTVLERIRPIDQKLKYQIEKLIKTALTGEVDENDPSRFKANPENMLNKMEESDNSGSDNEKEEVQGRKVKEIKSGVYVPPKLAAVHYEDDDKQSTRKAKEIERARKRALHSSVIQELKDEYLDTPVEIIHSNSFKAKTSRRQQEKREYEETYFTRLPTSRKDKHKSRQMMTVGNLGDQLTHFEDISALEGGHSMSKKRKAKKTNLKKSKTKKRKFQ
uniref:Neuroguidin n=1 Tax=Clastoptera arizonana TaxID=38151 RepID=A0A1B6CDM5_9HEMI